MKRIWKGVWALGLSLAAAAAAWVGLAPLSTAQDGPGWTIVVDGKTMGEWDKVGDTNWRLEDGALVADKRTSKEIAYLLSKQKYKDFQVYAEFWASDDANSGIFLRCQDPAKVGDGTCYEVNIFDQRPDPSYSTGAIVKFAEVTSPMPKAGGKWNTFEITAKGRLITVVMNGKKTAEVHNGLFVEGLFGLQHGSGTIKFRKVAIRPL